MIRVLVVEDSVVVRDFLVHLLEADPRLKVVGVAGNGEEALALVEELRPDVITMDIYLPGIDGFKATRRIMEVRPTPIVIVTGHADPGEVATTLRALEAGALTVIARPPGPGHPDHPRLARELRSNVRLMSEVRVVRRWAPGAPSEANARPTAVAQVGGARDIRVVAIGASTGGPLTIQTVLSHLRPEFRFPVLIVQHLTEGFVEGFSRWLNGSSAIPVHVARDQEELLPGHAYLAPDGRQMGISPQYRIALRDDGPRNGLCPSVSYLFHSVCQVFGEHAAAVLLSGMGVDGAEELKAVRDAGGLTIVQDRESSAIYGMPGTALKLNAAGCVLNPLEIAAALVRLSEEE